MKARLGGGGGKFLSKMRKRGGEDDGGATDQDKKFNKMIKDVMDLNVMERNEILLFGEVFRPLKWRENLLLSGRGDSDASISASSFSSVPPNEDGMVPARNRRGLVGRDKFIKRVSKLLFDRGERLIKLYGPEGCGKTSVVVDMVHEYKCKFPGGVIWLNGSSMVWDTHRFLVEEINQQSYSNVFKIEHLRQRLWKYLHDNQEPWCLVIDDAIEESLEWVPPSVMAKHGYIIITSKSKLGNDEALRVELPLLTARSASDLMLQFAGVDFDRMEESNTQKKKRIIAQTQQASYIWTDTAHLCRNILAMNLAGLLVKTYDITLPELLRKFDQALAKAVLPDLNLMLERYDLKKHLPTLKQNGVLNASDFVRGRPWNAIDKLSRKEIHQFERIQENLHRSHNRICTKILCKLWREFLEVSPKGRDTYELLRLCSFFDANYIPIDLLTKERVEAALYEQQGGDGSPVGNVKKNTDQQVEPEPGIPIPYRFEWDLIQMDSEKGILNIHSCLLNTMRSIHRKRTEVNRAYAKQVLVLLHQYCKDHLLLLDHQDDSTKPVHVQSDKSFRNKAIAMLPHMFWTVGICSELLLQNQSTSQQQQQQPQQEQIDGNNDHVDDNYEDLPEDFVVTNGTTNVNDDSKPKLQRRHSVFSVASGASSSSNGTNPSLATIPEGVQANRRASSASLLSHSSSDSRRHTGSFNAIKSLTKRFTPKSRRVMNIRGMIADIHLVQSMLLLLLPLGSFRVTQAERFVEHALQGYRKHEEKLAIRGSKFILGLCWYKSGRLEDALECWTELVDGVSDKVQKAYVLTSIATIFSQKGDYEEAISIYEESLGLYESPDLVSARTWIMIGHAHRANNEYKQSIKAFLKALKIYDEKSPISSISAEIHKMLTHLYMKTENYEKALVHAEEAMTVYTSPDAHSHNDICETFVTLGHICTAQQDHTSAIHYYTKCLDHADRLFEVLVDNPDNSHVLSQLAQCFIEDDSPDEAQEYSHLANKMNQRLTSWTTLYADYN